MIALLHLLSSIKQPIIKLNLLHLKLESAPRNDGQKGRQMYQMWHGHASDETLI